MILKMRPGFIRLPASAAASRFSRQYNNRMESNARRSARELAREFENTRDQLGWFDELYRSAAGDPAAVPWAGLAPSPLLQQQLDGALAGIQPGSCAVVGCGLGDDAEELARRGFKVSAFDLSVTAIDWCRTRWPDSSVQYRVADLLNLPPEMQGAFDFVVEINTLQAVPDDLRLRMLAPLAALLAPGGCLLVICRSRVEGQLIEGPPWALSRSELELLCSRHGLELRSLHELIDDETPPRGRFVACYCRPAGRSAK